jgi:hypothetical protein
MRIFMTLPIECSLPLDERARRIVLRVESDFGSGLTLLTAFGILL